MLNCVATPDHLLKLATQTRGAYPVIPPIQCLPARSDDEAASDPPDKRAEQGRENMDFPVTRTEKSREREREREK